MDLCLYIRQRLQEDKKNNKPRERERERKSETHL